MNEREKYLVVRSSGKRVKTTHPEIIRKDIKERSKKSKVVTC